MKSDKNLAKPGSTGSDAASVRFAANISSRMDRLPTTRYLWMLVFLISLGGFFETYDLIFIGYIAPSLTKSGLLATTTENFFGLNGIAGFIAAMFAGLFIGTFGLGFLPDRYGRRIIFMFALLWYSVGSGIMAFQSTARGLVLWRFITGIGVGVEIITIDVYVLELMPQHMRGHAIALNQVVTFSAAPIAALLSYFLVPMTPMGLDGWRWVILIGAGGAVIIWFIRLMIPESPRWLAQSGRVDEAERVLRKIETKVAAQYGRALPSAFPPIEVPRRSGQFREIWREPYRARMIMLLVFNFFQAIGYYGFNNWLPTLIIQKGIAVTKSLWYSFVIAIALPLGALLAMSVVDKFERKWLIVESAIVIAIFSTLFAQFANPAPIVFCGILISLAAQALSVSYHAYQSELFPTAIRSTASGLVYSFSRVGAGLSGFLTAFFLRDFGTVGVLVAIATCYLFVIAAIGIFGPKTTGKRLDEIAH